MCRAFGVGGYDDPRVATIVQRAQHRDVTRRLVHPCGPPDGERGGEDREEVERQRGQDARPWAEQREEQHEQADVRGPLEEQQDHGVERRGMTTGARDRARDTR